MGKTKDLTPRKISGVKMLTNTKSHSNREICRTLEISESSVRWIKKKINLGEELYPQRRNKCDRKPFFTLRSECCLKKIWLENRIAMTEQVKLHLKSRGIQKSERIVRHNLSKNKLHSPQTYLEAHINSCYGCKTSGMVKGLQGSRLGLLEIGKCYLINITALL